MLARVLLLGTLAFLVTAAPNTAINEQRATALRADAGPAQRLGDGICDICTNAIKSAEEYISDPETQATMAKYLQEQICDQLPESIAGTCKLEVPVVVNVVIMMLQQSVPPTTICTYMGLCDGTPSLADQLLQANGLKGPFDCPMCKMIIQVGIKRLQDPELRKEFEDTMNEACDSMPSDAQARCHMHVVALFKALDDLMHDIDPEGVCELALFCPASQKNKAALPTPEPLLRLKSAAVRLASLPPQPAGSLQDACSSCKTIVAEAAAIVQDPATQREILNYAKEGCEVFQDFKQQCETYVDLYGPLVLNMALQYLQPGPLCNKMGYCHDPAPPKA